MIELIGITKIDWQALMKFSLPENITEGISKSGYTYTEAGAWDKMLHDVFPTSFRSGDFKVLFATKGASNYLNDLGMCPIKSKNSLAIYCENVENWIYAVKQLLNKSSSEEEKKLGTAIYLKLEPIAREFLKNLSITKNKAGYYETL
jgi:hypothetical protein